jgi:hypothetical protein
VIIWRTLSCTSKMQTTLIWFSSSFCARSQRHYTAAGDGSHTAWTFNSTGPCRDSRLRLTTEFDGRPCWTDLTLEQERRSRAFKKGCSRNLWNVTYLGLRTVVLHKQPERAPAERRIPTQELRLAAYCQRIVNGSDPELKEHFSPSKLMDPVQRLREDYHSGHLRITNESDLEGIIIPGLTRSMARMVPVREDESGFRAFCIHSHIGWIKVRFSTYSRSISDLGAQLWVPYAAA